MLSRFTVSAVRSVPDVGTNLRSYLSKKSKQPSISVDRKAIAIAQKT